MVIQPVPDRAAAAGQSQLAVDFATAALRAGDVAEAQRLLRQRLAAAPDDANSLAKLGEIAISHNQVEQATVLLRRASVADPSPGRQMALVLHLQQRVGAAAALQEIEQLPAPVRASFDARATEAAVCGTLGLHDRQIAVYEQLTRDFPGNEALWMCIGNALKTVGRTAEAVGALRRAIAARPTYGEAYWTLANFKSFRFSGHDIAAMKRALRGKLADADALHFNFALGKALEDRDRFEPSFRHYQAGNAIRARSLEPEQLAITPFVNAAMETFTPALFERHRGGGCKAPDPLFVLGLQRSGSTLVEQILASHPLIEGTTELTIIQQIWDRLGRIGNRSRGPFQIIAALDPAALEQIGAEFLERTRPFRLSGRPLFIDKQPANWMHAGLIRLALPNARIIDARRHPMACGFSNFKQHYATGVTFSYSLEAIGHFYRDYWRFMNHLDQVQPGAIHRIVNERLIDDPEGEVRRLLDFVGVPFDPACLDFHRNPRAVNTPSAEQVRRPINRDGIDYWRHYEPWLGPLREALGPALEHWDRPPG